MRDYLLILVIPLFICAIALFGITGDYLAAKARTDALKVCVAHNVSLTECDAYWEKMP